MIKDEDQKLIDSIIVLSQLSSHRLREQTLQLIEKHQKQKIKIAKMVKNHNFFLKQIDKRSVVINETSTRKDMMLAQQSKMASMGEMMDAVAHQWKQPLNSLSMINDMLKDDFENGLVDEEYIDDITQITQMQIAHMVDTLSEFRDFFRPSKSYADFSLRECIASVEILMKDELIKNTINLSIEIQKDIILHGLVNEFKHLFLNLLSNSIDAFNEKNISNREITITSSIQNNNAIIEFEDNAQGIPNHVIADIFKPNVTTKAEGKGTGIGLYMSSQIVQKHHGIISVKNINSGARFTIVIKL
ncbi:MAG: HAMP domain-containing sensor histidine kinase [Sulfurimonas sp.]